MKKQQLVLHAIKKNPEAANDDAVLIAEVWRMEGLDISSDALRKLTRPETITRARRKLREQGLISETEEAREYREEAYRAVRDENGTPILFNI